jgi:GT2 family glycosyltransferase
MPVFNRLLATLECIHCLKVQTYHPITIIVVDGGSTDGTQECLRRDHPDIVLLEEKGLWWGGATRLGIDWALNHSTSDKDFVMLVNNDTLFGETYVATIIAHSRRHNAAICGIVVDANSPNHVLHAGVQVDWSTFSFKHVAKISPGEKINLDCSVLPGRGTVIPIHAVRKAGNVDDRHFPHYLSDYEFTYRLRTKGGILLGIAYDAVIRTPFAEPNLGQEQTATLSRRISQSFSRRSRRNIFNHYRFIDRHAPELMKRRLKFLLIRRHLKRILTPTDNADYKLSALMRNYRRGAALVFGTYLIPNSDIDRLGLDRARLGHSKLIAPSRYLDYFYPSASLGDLQVSYPEALRLYRRARNPLRKIARFIDAKLLDSSLEKSRRRSDLSSRPAPRSARKARE